VPWRTDASAWLGSHDRDLALDHSAAARLLDALGIGVRYMNGAEYSAYLHAHAGQLRGEALQFVVDYDDHWCAWFASHARGSEGISSGLENCAPPRRIRTSMKLHMRICFALLFAFGGCWAQPAKMVLILGTHAGDAERLGAPAADEYRAHGYRVEFAEVGGPDLDVHIDLTTATRRPRAQAAVSQFILARNPEITITHAMGEPGVVDHTVADLVYRSWQAARRKGARLGQLWFRAPDAKAGMISEPRFQRFFEPARSGAYYVVADARSPAPEPAAPQPAPSPAFQLPAGRQPVVMGIAAHADDFEESFGGTFAKLIREGWKGLYVITTNNTAGCELGAYNPSRPGGYFNIQKVRGPFPSDALETIQIRQEETRRAAAVFGVEPIFLNLNETFAWLGRQEIYMDDPRWAIVQAPGNGIITAAPEGKGLEMATALMKKYQPDLVLTMLLGDQNPEHGETGDLAYRAFVEAAQEGAQVGQLWMAMAGRRQYLERVRLEPYMSVDVTEQVPLAQKALAQHVSQNGGGPPIHQQQIGGKYYEHFVVIADRTGGGR
jgi:LmbE family N-acetylglucosaminyl deacetylase